MPTPTIQVTHRLTLAVYDRTLRQAAGRSVASYILLALLEKLERDEPKQQPKPTTRKGG